MPSSDRAEAPIFRQASTWMGCGPSPLETISKDPRAADNRLAIANLGIEFDAIHRLQAVRFNLHPANMAASRLGRKFGATSMEETIRVHLRNLRRKGLGLETETRASEFSADYADFADGERRTAGKAETLKS